MTGEEAERIRPKLEREIREVLDDFREPDGVFGPASTWISHRDGGVALVHPHHAPDPPLRSQARIHVHI